ncbi:MAG: glycosyl hydrolase, partial [Prevotella buccalis]|nr:glycosyl hydrolase [Hoylesella buccalis]
MKHLNTMIATIVLGCLMLLPDSMSAQFNWKYNIENGKIVTEVPQRPAGQQSALLMRTPKIKAVRVAFVGLGARGTFAVERWTHIPGIQVMALCDYVKEKAEN